MTFPTFDAIENFVATTVATAPSPATTGTSLVVASGTGGNFPTPPFDAVTWPSTGSPTASTAEIVRVTNIVTDTLTIVRGAQTGNDSGGLSNATIAVGWNIARCVMAKDLLDTQQLIPLGNYLQSAVSTNGTSSAPVNVMSFNIAANAVMKFECDLLMTCATTTTTAGSQFAVTAPSGATGAYIVNGRVASAATTVSQTDTTTLGSWIGPFAESTVIHTISVDGVIACGVTGGTVTIQTAGRLASTGTVTAAINSSLVAWRVG